MVMIGYLFIYLPWSDGSTINCIFPSYIILISEWRSAYGLSFAIPTSQIQLRATTHSADSSFLSIHRPSCYTKLRHIDVICFTFNCKECHIFPFKGFYSLIMCLLLLIFLSPSVIGVHSGGKPLL